MAGNRADITELLDRWGRGEHAAFEALMPMVYDELHTLAGHYLRHERSGHTLQPTALVHEAYMRLSGANRVRLRNRTHFYGAAAQTMRRVLVDHARRRNAARRGGGDVVHLTVETPIDMSDDLVALDEALDKLARLAPEPAKVVELRYFGGLSVDETAGCLGISSGTVKRRWTFARAWLLREIGGSAGASPADRTTNNAMEPAR